MIAETFSIAPRAEWGFIAPTDESESPLDIIDVTLPVQTHTDNVGVLTHAGQTFPDTDALITTMKGVAIGVRTADCVPIVMYAPDIEAIAAVHAGWKGTIAGIASKTFRMLKEMGADPAGIQVRTGIHICPTCYEIDNTLATRFTDKGLSECIIKGIHADPLNEREFTPRNPHLDLGMANALLMKSEGLQDCNHQRLAACSRHTPFTSHESRPKSADDNTRPQFLPSWRRTPGEQKRIITWIRLNP